MTCRHQLERAPSSRSLLLALVLGGFCCAGLISPLRSQESNGAPSVPALPSSTASSASTIVPRFTQTPIAPFGDISRFSSLSTPADTSFTGQIFDTNKSIQFGAPRHGASSQNPFSAVGRNQSPTQPPIAFGGRRANPENRFGVSPFALPSFGQTARPNTTLAPGAYANGLKFSSKDAFKFGSIFDDTTAHFSSSTMFTNSNLGNGVMFSAGTEFGSHRTVGAPVAGAGPAAKQGGASVAFKLSF